LNVKITPNRLRKLGFVTTARLYSLLKKSNNRHEVSGHDFSRADKPNRFCGASAPVSAFFANHAQADEFFSSLFSRAKDIAKWIGGFSPRLTRHSMSFSAATYCGLLCACVTSFEVLVRTFLSSLLTFFGEIDNCSETRVTFRPRFSHTRGITISANSSCTC